MRLEESEGAAGGMPRACVWQWAWAMWVRVGQLCLQVGRVRAKGYRMAC